MSAVSVGHQPLAALLPVPEWARKVRVGANSPSLWPDHRLGDEHGHVLAAVVDGDRVPDHLREDGRGPRPGLDHLLVAGLVHLLDALHQALLDERALLRGSAHQRLPPLRLPRRRPRTIIAFDCLPFLRVR